MCPRVDIRTNYPHFEPISLCSFGEATNTNLIDIRFYPIGDQTHDLPHRGEHTTPPMRLLN